jgi:hypothetical protein
LWPERIFVALAPAALGIVRPRGGAHAWRVLACEAPTGAEPWRGALDALVAAAADWREARAAVTVVLSNHFLRYALVPRDPALRGGAEELAYARHIFARIYGERSADWEVLLDDERRAPLRVACAIDGELRRGLQACFAPPSKARLVSLQPYLMAAFNHFRRQLAAPAAALLLLEPGRACLARLAHGRWARLSNLRGEFDAPEAWSALLAREQALDGDAPGREVLVRPPASNAGPLIDMALCAA